MVLEGISHRSQTLCQLGEAGAGAGAGAGSGAGARAGANWPVSLNTFV